MEDEKVFDDTQDQVVDDQVDDTEGSETPETTTVTEEPVAKAQSVEDNAKFAQARREAEAKMREYQAQNSRLIEALKGYGYEGSPEEIADSLIAAKEGITQEEARTQREAKEQQEAEKSKVQDELEFYKKIAIEKLMADDLRVLQEVYPEVKNLIDLGDEYMNLLTATKDPILAYEAVQAKKAKTEKPKPPEIGSVNTSTTKEKDFFTSEEVDKLTAEDYDRNPKLLEIVRKSMQKWK